VLAPYLAVLRVPGGPSFSAAGFVARLPISMVGLGMVLLVSARTGSYGLAGLVSAVFILANSAAAPLQARAADRIGQAAVLWPLLAGQAVGVALFLWAAGFGATARTWALCAAGVVVGVTLPQIGSMVRARWAALYSGTPLLHTAYALESVLDEAVFVLGPVLVTVLATQVHPYAGLAVTLLLTVGGGAALAVQRRTEPALAQVAGVGRRPPVPVGALLPLALAFVGLGAVFGAVDVSVVAAADEAGRRGVAGIVLACFALGSLLAGIVYGALHLSAPVRQRLLVAHGLLALVVLPLPLLSGLGALAAAALVVGMAISPTLVSGFSLVEEEVPAARLTEGLAWLSTALGAGVAVGATAAGRLVDSGGARAGMWVGVGAAVLAVVPAAVCAARRSPAASPAVPPPS
jgi:MFS family permease